MECRCRFTVEREVQVKTAFSVARQPLERFVKSSSSFQVVGRLTFHFCLLLWKNENKFSVPQKHEHVSQSYFPEAEPCLQTRRGLRRHKCWSGFPTSASGVRVKWFCLKSEYIELTRFQSWHFHPTWPFLVRKRDLPVLWPAPSPACFLFLMLLWMDSNSFFCI